jgi:hypothetical protein
MPASMRLTGSDASRNRLSGILIMSRTAMGGDVSGAESAVNPPAAAAGVDPARRTS